MDIAHDRQRIADFNQIGFFLENYDRYFNNLHNILFLNPPADLQMIS